VGDVRIMFSSPLSLPPRGKEVFWNLSLSSFLPFAKGGITPLGKGGARGDFLSTCLLIMDSLAIISR